MLVSAALAAAVLGACGSSGSDGGSDQFRDQTKSALLDFGEEGSKSALEEGAEVVQGFFAARAEGDWAGTCAQLSRSVLDKIKHLATTATGLVDTSCPSFLGAFMRLSAEERKESTIVDAGSLREQGPRAFLIYYGGSEAVYTMPLNREGSEWKIASLSPKQLN
ncbi:MAG: hypothetical protein QOF13_85 [Solirubrobacterales bacterium]|jgi:hypothetical protein|nr:hypothetical protein [Solirubrobacterales bacterium]